MSILKVHITIVPLFFLISYLWVPKIEICRKYFWTKVPKNSHCGLRRFWSNFESRVNSIHSVIRSSEFDRDVRSAFQTMAVNICEQL